MTGYLARRIGTSVITILLISLISFIFIALLPGDPAKVLLGEFATPEKEEIVTRKWGLDKPILYRYALWIANVLRGDLGESLVSRVKVTELLSSWWPVSVELCLLSLGFACFVGIPAGLAAVLLRKRPGKAFMAGILVAQSVPSYVSGLLLILIFSIKLGWLPSSGYAPLFENPLQNIRSMILPSVSLGLVIMAFIARFTRSAMLEVLNMDFVRTARSKGLAESSVLIRHAFRYALIPVISLLGTQLVWFLGGAIIQEILFVLPGMGRAVVRALMMRDFAVIQAVVLLMSGIAAMTNLLVDISYAILDPRIRYT